MPDDDGIEKTNFGSAREEAMAEPSSYVLVTGDREVQRPPQADAVWIVEHDGQLRCDKKTNLPSYTTAEFQQIMKRSMA